MTDSRSELMELAEYINNSVDRLNRTRRTLGFNRDEQVHLAMLVYESRDLIVSALRLAASQPSPLYIGQCPECDGDGCENHRDDTPEPNLPVAEAAQHSEIEALRKLAFDLNPVSQHRLAFFIAENIGMVLVNEPEHPDSPHATPIPDTSAGEREMVQQSIATKPSPMQPEDGRGKIKLREGTQEEIADYKAAFAAMRSPAGQAAMVPMMESAGDNAGAIQKLMGDFSTGELFNALLSRINFDGMDPRTFSLAELHGAIEGAKWPSDVAETDRNAPGNVGLLSGVSADPPSSAGERMREALELARKRIEYYGQISDRRHFDHDLKEIFPKIDAALDLQGPSGKTGGEG